jgi:hypothetical protein
MRTPQQLAWVLTLGLCTALALPVAGEPPAAAVQGRVKIPLEQYTTLLRQAEEVTQGKGEGTLATVAGQRLTVHLESTASRSAVVEATFEVEVRGDLPEGSVTVPLAFPALVERGAVSSGGIETPHGGLHRDGSGALLLVVRRSGSYRVELTGRVAVPSLEDAGALPRIPLGRAQAALAEALLDLPEALRGEVAGAVVVAETVEGGRRRARLSLRRDEHATAQLVRATESAEAGSLARAVVVTAVEVERSGIRRSDVVGFDVLRGALTTLRLTVPPAYSLERLQSDEGEVVTAPRVGDFPQGVLEIPRERRLKSQTRGHLTLTAASLPLGPGEVPLTPVTPEVEVRARYLLLAASVATEAEPLPAAAWARVDPDDLGSALESLLPEATVIWQWRGGEGGTEAPRLRLRPLPPAAARPMRVVQRETTSLLTVDGTLVHRERFYLAGLSRVYGIRSAFAVTLPGRARLWSATVDDVAVRPLERDGQLTIPLLPQEPYTSSEGPWVEVVSVEEQAIPPGRTVMDLALAVVDLPVVVHRWQLLLPEGNRYRYAGGSLTPAPFTAPRQPPAEGWRQARIRGSREGDFSHNLAGIEGVVRDANGEALPGVQVKAGGQTAITQADGRFLLARVAPGETRVLFHLSGMISVEREVKLGAGRVVELEVEMRVAMVEEVIVVGAEAPTSRAWSQEDFGDALEMKSQAQYRVNVYNLQQGSVGGVRPLPVEVPEEGKGLFLAGVLPPSRVTVQVEVKRKR